MKNKEIPIYEKTGLLLIAFCPNSTAFSKFLSV